jgi:hypothetical protein
MQQWDSSLLEYIVAQQWPRIKFVKHDPGTYHCCLLYDCSICHSLGCHVDVNARDVAWRTVYSIEYTSPLLLLLFIIIIIVIIIIIIIIIQLPLIRLSGLFQFRIDSGTINSLVHFVELLGRVNNSTQASSYRGHYKTTQKNTDI